MQIIRGLHNCQPAHRNSVLTIGNFDGLHLGHLKILEQLAGEADRLQTQRCMMTFEPLPGEYFSPEKPIARLMNRYEKMRLLNSFPDSIRPEYLLFMRFDEALASMKAGEFIEKILLEQMAVKTVIVGDDFRFGCDRKGSFAMLQEYADRHHFKVISMESHHVDHQRASSTLIRQALSEGRFADADRMLGRRYTICGHVNHGDKRGRTIGFPTANILLKRPETPLGGVYSVTMHSDSNGDIAGIANLGKRPTVDGTRVQLEVHLFDFDASLYGEQVCISFQHKIRDEIKFESFDDLKQQIKLDCKIAREHLA